MFDLRLFLLSFAQRFMGSVLIVINRNLFYTCYHGPRVPGLLLRTGCGSHFETTGTGFCPVPFSATSGDLRRNYNALMAAILSPGEKFSRKGETFFFSGGGDPVLPEFSDRRKNQFPPHPPSNGTVPAISPPPRTPRGANGSCALP